MVLADGDEISGNSVNVDRIITREQKCKIDPIGVKLANLASPDKNRVVDELFIVFGDKVIVFGV